MGRAVLAESVDLVTVVDADGVVQYQNPVSEPVLGYDPERLEGTHVGEFLHPEDASRAAGLFERGAPAGDDDPQGDDPQGDDSRADGGTESVDGTREPADDTTEPADGDSLQASGVSRTGAASDPSEATVRVRAADDAWVALAARSSGRRRDDLGGYVVTSRPVDTGEDPDSGEILDRMTDGFFALDEGWQVVYANDTAREVIATAVGSDLEGSVVGLDFWERMPDAEETPFYDRYHEAVRTGEPVSFEEYYGPLDTWFDVRAYPSPSGLSVYFRDCTEERRTREALAHRETVLREIHDVIADREKSFREQVRALLELGRRELDMTNGTLSHIDGEEYVFEVVSSGDGSVSEGDVAPTAATNCEIVAADEESLALGDVLRDAPEQADRAGYTEWGITCYLGAPVFLDDEVYGTFCFFDTEPRDGQFSDWEVTFVDLLSQWASYELQRERRREELAAQNDRLEEFASIVSHDLRNPLNVLDGSLELVATSDDPEHLERCRRSVERMETMIDELLTLARSGELRDDPAPQSLETVVRESWDQVATADATLRVEGTAAIRADETRLRQVIENLLRNAVQHGGDDVTVTVRTTDDGFAVGDDGPGIPLEDRERVLESGYSTEPDGTGYGLGIVSEIAAAHGWTVEVTESPAGGAEFVFAGVESAEDDEFLSNESSAEE